MIKKIQAIMKNHLIKKNLGNIMIIQAGKKALKDNIGENKYSIKIKNNSMFIIGGNNFQNLNIFLKKNQILTKTNEYIEKFGYSHRIENIIIKQ